MSSFERGYVVLDEAAQPHDLDGVRAQSLLLMIPQRDVEKYAGQEHNNGHARGRS